MSHGRYPCVARGARGRSHGGNVGRDFGTERTIHVVGVCGGRGHHFRGAGQAEVGACDRNNGVAATATRISVSRMQDAMALRWGTSLNSREWRN